MCPKFNSKKLRAPKALSIVSSLSTVRSPVPMGLNTQPSGTDYKDELAESEPRVTEPYKREPKH